MAQSDNSAAKAPDKRKGKPSGPVQLLVIRHAVAEEQSVFAASGRPDAERPLSSAGKRKFRAAAKGLVQLVPEVGLIATSPLKRTVETTYLLTRRYRKCGENVEPIRLAALAPGKPPNLLLSWLSQHRVSGPVIIVGHEPNLGQFVSWVLTGLRESFIEFKKGGACLLEFDDEIRAGRARLLWSLQPRQLRKFARSK